MLLFCGKGGEGYIWVNVFIEGVEYGIGALLFLAYWECNVVLCLRLVIEGMQKDGYFRVQVDTNVPRIGLLNQ